MSISVTTEPFQAPRVAQAGRSWSPMEASESVAEGDGGGGNGRDPRAPMAAAMVAVRSGGDGERGSSSNNGWWRQDLCHSGGESAGGKGARGRRRKGRERAQSPPPRLFIRLTGGGGIVRCIRVAGVAACIFKEIAQSGAKDPADVRGRARAARGGSHISLIVARRPVFRGEFEAARGGQQSSQGNRWADRRS